MKNPVYYVPTVDARDLSYEISEWCAEQDISTHYECGIHQLQLDGNLLQLFFEDNGVKFTEEEIERGFAEVGVIGT